MNPALAMALVEIGKAAVPELLAAIKTLRSSGVLTDTQIADTEAKASKSLEQMQQEEGIDRL